MKGSEALPLPSTLADVPKLALIGRKKPVLHQVAAPVEDFTGQLHDLALRMAVTCRHHGGLALAAPQVGLSVRLVVLASGRAVINPVVHAGGPLVTEVERCLSIPGRRYAVERHARAVMVGLDIDGRETVGDVSGIDARLWQHEVDHLDGILVSDHWPEVRDG